MYMSSHIDDSVDLRPRCTTYLVCGVLLAVLAPQTSDIATIWMREPNEAGVFEYPVLARSLYLAERTVAPSRVGIALVNSVVGVVAAAWIIGLLRRDGGRESLWMGAPSLILIS